MITPLGPWAVRSIYLHVFLHGVWLRVYSWSSRYQPLGCFVLVGQFYTEPRPIVRLWGRPRAKRKDKKIKKRKKRKKTRKGKRSPHGDWLCCRTWTMSSTSSHSYTAASHSYTPTLTYIHSLSYHYIYSHSYLHSHSYMPSFPLIHLTPIYIPTPTCIPAPTSLNIISPLTIFIFANFEMSGIQEGFLSRPFNRPGKILVSWILGI